MSKPRVCVLRAPGTNCDIETAHAFELAGGEAERLHLFRLLENPALLDDFQILCIPGGFSYGDDVGAGVIFSRHLRGKLNDAMQAFRSSEKLILGICNGFQVILKAGLLQSTTVDEQRLTLTWNNSGRYVDRWVRLKTASSKCVFLRDIDELDVPIAHAEGRIAVKDQSVLEGLRTGDQMALCYWGADAEEQVANGRGVTEVSLLPEPVNPNGSVCNLAGLCDETGRVLGLMPHPERFLFATQHPQWTRLGLSGEGAGLKLFQNAVDWFA